MLEELRLYATMVSEGSYLIVEDTNINGHPVFPSFGPGPYEAVTKFLAERSDFSPEREREKFLLTFNPRGYLKKLSAAEVRAGIAEVPGETEVAPDPGESAAKRASTRSGTTGRRGKQGAACGR